MKELEIKQENFKDINLHKRAFFDAYLKSAGTLYTRKNMANLDQIERFSVAYYQILPYIPSEKVEAFRIFSEQTSEFYLNEKEPENNDLLHEVIIPTIKKEIELL